ncbi:DUF1205 domain-containing protein [Crossiella sp. CA-258035]|uniref:nucleotide disphospho-sugar-binding domain-containing protein n=1 Tax=Crossiella sp. CA-258035 TaxID=2981138 RepID=UPI0024BC83ED|nr:nucleotide disphospho-sugar-binding domain-containing protein [Crossiella sp. CA-258035]WHT23328.1 DUF1205 domain-containing protein [Crossiella sp. CA-258035]
MRVLFTTFPWASHHYTMVPLAWAFRAAGHEVVVASTPALESTITGSGLPAVNVGTEVDLARMSAGPRLANWHEESGWPTGWTNNPSLLGEERLQLLERLAGLQFAMAGAMVDDLVDFSRAWRPDLVVHNTVSFAGPVAAAVLGVPSVSHHWGGPGLHRVEMRRLGSEPLPGYVALFERFGAPVRSPSLWIDMCPESLRIPTSFPCLPVRYIPYNGPGTMPDWALDKPARRRVCVTWGETTLRLLGPDGLEMFGKTVRALADLDAEVLVVTTAAQLEVLGDLPANVRPALSVPLHMLLDTCDVIVHHGGSGTVMTATAFGVPQLAITRRPEPELHGERLAAVGAGRHLPYGRISRDSSPELTIRAEVETMLNDPSYREAAQRIQAEVLARPTPDQVVPDLEKLCLGGTR